MKADALRPEQRAVVREIFANRVLLHLPTGFGKTEIALYLSTKFDKVLVIAPLRTVVAQWRQRIARYECTNIDLHCTHTFHNMTKLRRFDYDAVIVDEAHMCERMVFAEILRRVGYDFLLGLSASPTADTMAHFEQTVVRHVRKNISVYPVHLHFPPEIHYTRVPGKGVVFDYNRILASVTSLEARAKRCAEVIAEAHAKFEGRVLVLVKNVATVRRLAALVPACVVAAVHRARQNVYAKLRASRRFGRARARRARRFFRRLRPPRAPRVDLVYGNVNRPGDAPVVVGTYQKISVGFDDDTFKVLVLMDNVKNIIQSEGRIRRDKFVIVDLIDAFCLFHNHWRQRRAWYESRGGIIKHRIKWASKLR